MRILYSIGAIVAGFASFGAAVVINATIAMATVPYFSPDAFNKNGPANSAGRAAFFISGCIAVLVGGYVSAWIASRVGRSELKHALSVGVGIAVLAVWSDATAPIAWNRVIFLFTSLLICATIGGYLRAWQVERRRSTSATESDQDDDGLL